MHAGGALADLWGSSELPALLLSLASADTRGRGWFSSPCPGQWFSRAEGAMWRGQDALEFSDRVTCAGASCCRGEVM